MNSIYAVLRKYLEDHFDGDSLDLVKQYTHFKAIGDNVEERLWYFGCVEDVRKEGIYDIFCVKKPTEEGTRLHFNSWKSNYEPFCIVYSDEEMKELFEKRKKDTTPEYIFSGSLYPDHTPSHFKGRMWTRGAAVGWNCFYIRENTYHVDDL